MTMQPLPDLIEKRLTESGPIRAALIGAGKFGSMFLAQLATSPHIRLTSIADLDTGRARKACHTVGMTDEAIAAISFTSDGLDMIRNGDAEVIIDATGHPAAGIHHALAAMDAGKHIIMANVEADVLAGPALAAQARRAGTVFSMAYGDQPALVCELIDWARTCGFSVVAAGKGTRYQPEYHASTPDTVWDAYGKTPEEAAAAGMNPQMFNSFLDGTKSSIEMAAIANATGLNVPEDGLKFPPSSHDELATVLCPAEDGGVLDGKGYVEVVASARRGANQDMDNNLRWGVYVVIEAPNNYTRACFEQYGVQTDPSGRYAALYRPYHMIGLEIGVSVVNAALLNQATGQTRDWRGDVVAVAKTDLKAGTMLDGEGGYCVWGKLMPAARSARMSALPIGLAHGIKLVRDISAGQVVTEADVEEALPSDIMELRARMKTSIDA